MTDPFEALREPVTPVDPDPDFAGRLRVRLVLWPRQTPRERRRRGRRTSGKILSRRELAPHTAGKTERIVESCRLRLHQRPTVLKTFSVSYSARSRLTPASVQSCSRRSPAASSK